jgi:phosphohistidine phosphatase
MKFFGPRKSGAFALFMLKRPMPQKRRGARGMRRLLLLRHARAERAPVGARDIDRALTGQGREDAARIGAYLARHAVLPDRAMVSPAARSQETWALAAAALPFPLPRVTERRVYDATADTLFDLIKATEQSIRTLIIIGHNPGLHECAVRLIAFGDIDARTQLNQEFPPAGLIAIDFMFDNWGQLAPHSGHLERFITPKSIGAAAN